MHTSDSLQVYFALGPWNTEKITTILPLLRTNYSPCSKSLIITQAIYFESFFRNHQQRSLSLIPSCLQISLSPLLLVDITAFRLNLFPSCCSLVLNKFVVRNLVGTWKTSCEFDWNSTDVNIVISRAIRLEDQLWIRWEFPRCQYQRVARFLCTILAARQLVPPSKR